MDKVFFVLSFVIIWTILPGLAQEGVNPSVITPCSYNDLSRGPKTYILGKTRESRDTAAIVQIDEDGKAVLNPAGIKFPIAASVVRLTSDAANQLWGVARNSGRFKTFDLYTIAGEPNIFHIDAQFDDAGIRAYRIRGIGILNPKWISAGTGEEGCPPSSKRTMDDH